MKIGRMRDACCMFLMNLLAVAWCCHAAAGQAAGPPDREQARIARLIGLARVWGDVKLFHPSLAAQPIAWDNALIDAIPKVNAAASPQSYAAVINGMLAKLQDRNTFARIDSAPGGAPQRAVQSGVQVRRQNGTLTVPILAIAQAINMDTSREATLWAPVVSALPTAASVLIDCRGNESEDADPAGTEYFLDRLFRQLIARLANRSVPLGSLRYRLHDGYAPQVGATSGGYFSGMVVSTPEVVDGLSNRPAPPTIVLINDRTPDIASLLSGLQATGRASLVQEGTTAPEIGVRNRKVTLPEGVIVRIRTTETVNPDGSVGLKPDKILPIGSNPAVAESAALALLHSPSLPHHQSVRSGGVTLQSGKDDPYPEMKPPSYVYRLLALFRFWTVIDHLYPYKNLIADTWDTVLPRYIPKFEAAGDALAFETAVMELVAELHDSHAVVRGLTQLPAREGDFLPPIAVRTVGDQTVVTTVIDPHCAVHLGDVLLEIDGEPITARRAASGRLLAASTPQALALRVDRVLLGGSKDSALRLRLRDPDGKVREVTIKRTESRADPRYYLAQQRTTPIVQILPDGFGYVDLARLQPSGIDAMFETIKQTPAVIFDMRGYPNGTAWAIAPRLTARKNITGALFSRPIWEARNLGDEDYAGGTDFTFPQLLPAAKGTTYNGKVVMLINNEAISQAEHTCLLFEAATEVTFIGTPTEGANGDVTNLVLPGNIVVNFSGHAVRHADGRQLQRVGIQPTRRVEPTPRGIAEGRDEILEAALSFLKTGN